MTRSFATLVFAVLFGLGSSACGTTEPTSSESDVIVSPDAPETPDAAGDATGTPDTPGDVTGGPEDTDTSGPPADAEQETSGGADIEPEVTSPCDEVDCAKSDVPCMVAVCNPDSGQCELTPTEDGASCDDGDACTGEGTCAGGTCVGGDPVTCDDDDACNGVETCDPTDGCLNGDPLTCDDDDACNGVETCDPTDGCLSGDPLTCDDDNSCTEDSCDTGEGCITSALGDGAPCDDGEGWICDEETCVDPNGPCADSLVIAPSWFAAESDASWSGTLEFGQTHVTEVDDPRIAPPLVQERETLFLFTPDVALDAAADVRVAAYDGETLLGVLQATPPADLTPSLETLLTAEPLESYSETVWSGFLPWSWLKEGVQVHVGHVEDDVLYMASHTFEDLGAPHQLTLSRAKIVLFGDADHGQLLPAEKLAQDMFAAVPVAELRVIESTPWIPPYVVVANDDGPKRVHSIAEYDEATSGADRWQILKQQFALRMNVANTGRGLWRTSNQTDGSPYSFGTSIGLGWVKNDDGTFSDVNNAPYAAGWTGWTALWLGECGNVTIHELGHSFTMLHFTSGTAENWGIADEYPEDGTNLETHPWGFDSSRRMFRTWYRVDAGGIVTNEDGSWVGKRDPLNGGEKSNAVTCFPQYTGYHAHKMHAWSQGAPTLRLMNGAPSVVQWNTETHAYDHVEPGDDGQPPIGIDVPTVTLIGTLASTAEGSQTYPPFFWSAGNVFELPDPEASGEEALLSVYDGGQYFLEIHYADKPSQRALISNPEITGAELRLFSVNLPLEDQPTQVDLYLSPTGYPDVDVNGATLLHTRAIDAHGPLKAPVSVGRENLANGRLSLNATCTAGDDGLMAIDCKGRTVSSRWRNLNVPLTFSVVAPGDAVGEAPAAGTYCSPAGEHSSFTVTAVRDAGTDDEANVDVVVHAQRIVETGGPGGSQVAVPLNDATSWADVPDAMQGIRLWIPYGANSGLEAGAYTSAGDTQLVGWLNGSPSSLTPVNLDFTVYELMDADLTNGFDTPTLPNEEASSSYFIVEDPSMGPSTGEWWNGSHDLFAPVIDTTTGLKTTLKIRGWKVACGDSWDFNSGQANWDCEYHAHLEVEEGANPQLTSGHTYVSPGSSPLVVIGKRWHKPNQGAVTGIFPLSITYTAP
ncbi:MAG: M66 family metalloprotease [Myxococcota bacterium]|nr:M66 family metalloprotease [Myxococcota bacterium]